MAAELLALREARSGRDVTVTQAVRRPADTARPVNKRSEASSVSGVRCEVTSAPLLVVRPDSR